MGIPAQRIVQGAGGTFWRIYSNGQAQQVTDRKVIHELTINPRGYGVQKLSYRYDSHGGNAIAPPGQTFSNFQRDGKYGTIYGVTNTGQYVNLNPAQYEQLGRPGYTQYSFNPQLQSAFDLMNQTLKSWGLENLAGVLRGLIVKGDTNADTLSLALSQTPEYKQRFAGNAARVAAGLPELSPAQYIATEEQYRNVLRSYGLPPGFYDQNSDLTKFIANDVSPTELENRVKVATDQYLNWTPAARAEWAAYFGVGAQGDAVAQLLDPKRYSLTDLQNKATQVGIGASALDNGLKVSQQRAQYLQEQGVTLAGAQKAYADIAQFMGTDQSIANRFGGSKFTQTQEENARLLSLGPDQATLNHLYSEEQGLFAGRGTVTPQSLAPNTSGYL